MSAYDSELVAGKYRLEAVIGKGGMGEVWRARDVELERWVAVKLIHPFAGADPDLMTRFRREARALALLGGRHIVRVFDYGDDRGSPYMAMELLEGEDLRARCERGPMPLSECVGIIVQLCSALERAHAAGVIHRDLKPGNVFIACEGGHDVVKVLDFGIAKLREVEHDVERTRTRELLGAPHYMSPEQARSSRDADERSDLWSLAVIFYRVLTGVRPFDGDGIAEVVHSVRYDEPVPPSRLMPGLPKTVDRFFEIAFQRDPERRFQTASEFAGAARALLEVPMPRRAPLKAIATVVGVALVASAAAAATGGVFTDPEPEVRLVAVPVRAEPAVSASSAPAACAAPPPTESATPVPPALATSAVGVSRPAGSRPSVVRSPAPTNDRPRARATSQAYERVPIGY